MKAFVHPNITVNEPVSGLYLIEGFNPASVFIKDVGHFVVPNTCIIPKDIPAELLRLIADAKDGKESPAPAPVKFQLPVATPVSVEPREESNGGQLTLEERVLNVLAEGNIQVTKLAERLDVTPDAIKALDATSEAFHIAAAGWVKLGSKPAAE